jgi:hypothetical protein
MLADLAEYVKSPPLPDPDISVASLRERPLAVGNRLGTELRASFAAVEQKGGRLEAVVRFQVWGGDPASVDTRIKELNGRLLAAKEELLGRFIPSKNGLWSAGFLRLEAEGISPGENVSGPNAWRKWADYRVLYEYHYFDTDGAGSLIARIPIDINSIFGESTVVTDEMVRWDDMAAPALELNGRIRQGFSVGAIYILAHLPGGWDGSSVKISTSSGGLVREKSFASLRVFRDAFDLEKESGGPPIVYKTVELAGKCYFAGRMAFPNVEFPDPIKLKERSDFFQISYGTPPFDSDAVVYLRLMN